ncbi:MAG: hypothetical protein EXR72_23995 [Myxococcales bacterium]|nr:hypothetical protein [Myxococcales bacterium]
MKRPRTSLITAENLRDALIRAGGAPPPSLFDEIQALGEAALPVLRSMVADEDLSLEESPGAGFAPLHAIRLLGRLRDAISVPVIVALLREADASEIVFSEAIFALAEMGEAAVEPCLEELARRGHSAGGFAEVLGKLGVRDERVFEALVAFLDDDVESGAGVLANYGDERAVPHLLRAFERLVIDREPGLFANQTAIELQSAIDDLGGETPPALAEKFKRAMHPRTEAMRAASEKADLADKRAQIQRAPRPGRNERCPCGSGKKYKKCHLGEDERGV